MKHYTKKTIALCLASVLTVVGAFGAENYKNSLVSLKINNGSGGYISMTAYTEKPDRIPVKTVRQDANTYIVIYPETRSDAKPPNINSYENIESINISTVPYTNDSDGYTKIIIKTLGAPSFRVNTTVYLPGGQNQNYAYIPEQRKSEPVKQTSYWDTKEREQSKTPSQNTAPKTTSTPNTPAQTKPAVKPVTQSKSVEPEVPKTTEANNKPPVTVQPNYNTQGGISEYSTVLISILSLLVIIGFIFTLSKDKMASVVGERHNFDLDSENKPNKKSRKRKSIKRTINQLDEMYKKPSARDYYSNFEITNMSPSKEEGPVEQPEKVQEEEQEEKGSIVVDLDTLYQEKQNSVSAIETSEHDDLADFLNEFKFDEPEIPEEEEFNEELYQEIINNNDIKFSKTDIDLLNQLMQVELTPDMLEKVDKYLEWEASKPKPKTKEQVLEDILTTYSVSRNIEFSKDDVEAIKQIMEVELDKDFVTDLSVDKERVKKAEEELTKKNAKPHKASDIITLNVKDMLPDLSKELKKQGKKPIESEVKPDVVYFSEGYEYSKLSVSNELSDISSALKKKNANKHRPSDFLPVVEEGYEYTTLSIKDELPDLEDVKAHPKKYEDKKPEKYKPDEKALLKSISNVTFKPFYTDVQAELNQFENFEVVDSEEDVEKHRFREEKAEQEPLQEENSEKPEHTNETAIPVISETVYTRNDRINDEAEKLLKLIEEQKTQRALKKQAQEEELEFKKELLKASRKKEDIINKNEAPTSFEYKGVNYTLLKKLSCDDTSECVLAKSENGYDVFGQVNGIRKELKHYDSLNSVNMQVRENEKQEDGSMQYLIKIGLNKFVIKLLNNNMEFVMDLC